MLWVRLLLHQTRHLLLLRSIPDPVAKRDIIRERRHLTVLFCDLVTVAISNAAHRLISGLFVVEDLGSQPLKGIEQPLQLIAWFDRVECAEGFRRRLRPAD
jgi:class 3 adenylate cyclase